MTINTLGLFAKYQKGNSGVQEAADELARDVDLVNELQGEVRLGIASTDVPGRARVRRVADMSNADLSALHVKVAGGRVAVKLTLDLPVDGDDGGDTASAVALETIVKPALLAKIASSVHKEGERARLELFEKNVWDMATLSPCPGPCMCIRSTDDGRIAWTTVSDIGEPTSWGTVTVFGPDHVRSAQQDRLRRALVVNGVRSVAVGGSDPVEALAFVHSALAPMASKPAVTFMPFIGLPEQVTSVDSSTMPAFFAVAASFARRLQDPLAELVNIGVDRLRIGDLPVGMQPKVLVDGWDRTIDEAVDCRGIDVNTAPVSFLTRMPGIEEDAARRILDHRRGGPFVSKQALVDRKVLSAEQLRTVAGHIRVHGHGNALDGTGLHPGEYPVLRWLAGFMSTDESTLVTKIPKATLLTVASDTPGPFSSKRVIEALASLAGNVLPKRNGSGTLSRRERFSVGNVFRGHVLDITSNGVSVTSGRVRAFLPWHKSGIREPGSAEFRIGDEVQGSVSKVEGDRVIISMIDDAPSLRRTAKQYGPRRPGAISLPA